jgi:tRNA(Ile)-lysidine synthase
MAARALRYEWFEVLRQNVEADSIATGHHLNDNVETFLLNLTRGTGLRGLSGMKPRQGHIVRPLLFAKRSEIELFASRQNIPFRKDKSNDDISIPRNRIRNNVIPQIEQINPSFIKTMYQNMGILNDWLQFSQQHLQNKLENRVSRVGVSLNLQLTPDDDSITQRLMLFEVLSGLGYAGNQVADCLKLLCAQTGKNINIGKHRVIRDRSSIVILENALLAKCDILTISLIPFRKPNPFGISVEISEKDLTIHYASDKNAECVDLQKIKLPLTIRPWQAGDRFYPLGMKGSKKVSDFLTDTKVNPAERKNQLVLTDKKGIVWVVGKRLDSRYATDRDSTSFLVLKKDLS